MSNSDYGIVLIDYNSLERTQKYIQDILIAFDVLPSHIVIIDNYLPSNYSNLENLLSLKEEKPEQYPSGYRNFIKKSLKGFFSGIEVDYIKSNTNLGFAKANNFGVAILANYNVENALISNSDIVFENRIKISKFVKILNENTSALADGSDVFRIDGTRQSPCQYLSIYDRWWRGKLLWPLLKPFYKEKSEVIDPGELSKVYRIIGAFFMINIKRFLKIGGFDEDTFLYGEELILAERARKIGLDILFFPGQKVLHEDGYTTKNKNNQHKKMLMQLSSDLYYYKKYVGVNKIICKLTWCIVNSYNYKKKFIQAILSGRDKE